MMTTRTNLSLISLTAVLSLTAACVEGPSHSELEKPDSGDLDMSADGPRP